MTILSLHSTSASFDIEEMISPPSGKGSPQTVAQIWSIPRINLRKRPCGPKITNLESVNSAFLSGIFADVAKASENSPSDDCIIHKNVKKARINQSKSMQRCDRSFAVLMKSLNDKFDEDPHNESCANSNTATTSDIMNSSHTSTIDRENSLQYQLNCVTSSSSEAPSSKGADVSSTAVVAFPYLPATVSNSSYGNNMNQISNNNNNHNPISSPITTLTHVISDLQSSVSEKQSQSKGNDTYGWFVEMEDETPSTSTATSLYLSSCGAPVMDAYFAPKDLAFSAQVAPKAENYDAELEWATAADTVDDVLGDFF